MLVCELLVSLSGKPSLSVDVIPVLEVIRARHICRSATYCAPIMHSLCLSLEGKINLDVADLGHQVTCLQLQSQEGEGGLLSCLLLPWHWPHLATMGSPMKSRGRALGAQHELGCMQDAQR